MPSQMLPQRTTSTSLTVDPFLSLCLSAFVVLAALRFFGVIDWSWWLVCIPLFMILVSPVFALLLGLLGTAVAGTALAAAGVVYFICVEPWTKRKARARDAYWDKREAEEAAERAAEQETSNR